MQAERLFEVGAARHRPSLKFVDLGYPRDPRPRQDTLMPVEGRHCPGCPLRRRCGAMYSRRHACSEFPVDEESARFHPTLGLGRADLDRVGGPEINVVARPVKLPPLDQYIPQIRNRLILRGQLRQHRAYAIRLEQVLRREVRSAAEIREACGVADWQAVVLLGFADDTWLEKLWERPGAVRAIAEGGWDAVVAPSYSLWWGRPRPMHLHAIARSFEIYAFLLELGVSAIPRVAFATMADVEHLARWCNANPCVGTVAADLMTLRKDQDWLESALLLTAFDDLTGQRLEVLVNGTKAIGRLVFLLELLGDRLRLTDATMATPPASLADKYEQGSSDRSWASRVDVADERIRVAERIVAERAALRSAGLRGAADAGPRDAERVDDQEAA